MAIMLPFIQKDPFGGPAGGTQSAVQQILQGILMGQERRKQDEQNQLLSRLFQDSQQSQQNYQAALPQYENQLSNFESVTAPDSPYEPSGMQMPSTPPEPMDFTQALLSNPNLDWDAKTKGMKFAQAQSDMEKNAAYADYLRQKPASTREPKQYEISFWDPTGKRPGGKVLATDQNYNSIARKLTDAGYTFDKPEKQTGGTSEFERLVDKLEGAKNITEDQKNRLIKQRVQKMVTEGSDGDETNKITLGDGRKVTLAELRAQYREKYNIPDEFELTMMDASPDPQVRQQAMRLKAEAATKPSFVEFMRDAKERGLEGLRPGSLPPGGQLPPLPPGFKVD